MALSKEAYQALEDVVGAENISAEPVVLDSYMGMVQNVVTRPDRSVFGNRAGAAVLPGSTEEVQAVIKVCNRYGIKCKAFSTGWGMGVIVSSDNVIHMDLRRMDRILEIDEKNMYAVVEPYVIVTQLQAEVMKLGLNCHMTGAGGSCSSLAVATSTQYGPDSIFQGHGSEILLGLEWVMPDGEILRTGSLGSGLGWFCGEGPGPSLRGLARSKEGLMGALGVFTRCAVKLAPWPGPTALPIAGTVPAYNTPLPDNIRTYTLAFPSWQAYADAYHKIYDSEIGYVVHRQFSKLGEDLWPAFYAMYNDPTKSLDDLDEIARRPEVKKMADEMRHYAFQFILAGMTPGDVQFQEKALDQLLAETGGHKVAAMSKPPMEAFTALYLLRLPSKHLNNVFAGGKSQGFAQHGTPDFVVGYAPAIISLMHKYQGKGKLVDCGDDQMMGPLSAIGGGGITGFEEFCSFEPMEADSVSVVREFREEARKVSRELGMQPRLEGTGLEGMTHEQLQPILAASEQPVRFHWQWKIKQMLDPKGTGDSRGYHALEKPPKE